jgi:hypothetical protein
MPYLLARTHTRNKNVTGSVFRLPWLWQYSEETYRMAFSGRSNKIRIRNLNWNVVCDLL